MPRGLDHIVHSVHDLDAVAALYRKLGFTVGARNRHDWGTHNHVVQLPGFFVELLTVAEPDKIVRSQGRTFSFGGYIADWLTQHQGFAMLVAESGDAVADRQAFMEAKIGDFDPFYFERQGRRPDGSAVTVAFSLAFARDEDAPGAGFFVCQQHYPENFWNPTFQQHANGVVGIAGVVLVAREPARHARFISAFADAPVVASACGYAVETPRGRLEVLDEDVYQARFGATPPDVSTGGARLAALRFAARDLGQIRHELVMNGIDAIVQGPELVVGPELGLGATIAFSQAEQPG